MHIVICNQGCKLYLKLYCTIHGYLNHKWEYCPACTLTYSFSRNRSFHLCPISFSTPAFRYWKFPLFSSGLECWWCGHVRFYPIICLALLCHRFHWIWFVCFDKSKHHVYIVLYYKSVPFNYCWDAMAPGWTSLVSGLLCLQVEHNQNLGSLGFFYSDRAASQVTAIMCHSESFLDKQVPCASTQNPLPFAAAPLCWDG